MEASSSGSTLPVFLDSDKNKKLGAEDTTSACYKQVLYRVKGIIAEHNSPAKQVKPIAGEGL